MVLSNTAILNDQVRTGFPSHPEASYIITIGVSQLSPIERVQLWAMVLLQKDFESDNDPYGEHDFGAVTLKGERFFWKIDDYGPDHDDETHKRYVLTVMRADEY